MSPLPAGGAVDGAAVSPGGRVAGARVTPIAGRVGEADDPPVVGAYVGIPLVVAGGKLGAVVDVPVVVGEYVGTPSSTTEVDGE